MEELENDKVNQAWDDVVWTVIEEFKRQLNDEHPA